MYLSFSSSAQFRTTGPKNIKWADYKGVIDPKMNYDAVTMTYIRLGSDTIGNKINYHVFAIFAQNSSWVAPNNPAFKKAGYSEYLLNHERLHYSITILNAKKLKQYIQKHPLHSKAEGVLLLDKCDKQNQAESDLYDKETNHGRNSSKQKEWEVKITSELIPLKDVKLEGMEK